jgi:hypothetical protein
MQSHPAKSVEKGIIGHMVIIEKQIGRGTEVRKKCAICDGIGMRAASVRKLCAWAGMVERECSHMDLGSRSGPIAETECFGLGW